MLHSTKGYCFIKCVNFSTGGNYREQYFDFIKIEKRRSTIMTMPRIQPLCGGNIINLGDFDETRDFPRSVTERNKTLRLSNNHFCLIWKSQGVSFIQAKKN